MNKIIKKTKNISISFATIGIILLSTASLSPINALYGSDNVLGTTTHEPVSAGLGDILPELVLASTAITGMIGTIVLLKKTE